MFPSSRSKVGSQGEEKTAQFLVKQGFTIIERNFRVRGGEIDIIALKDKLLVFVEVKSRSTIYFNTSQVITKSKQKKIILTAKIFLTRQRYIDKACRFDVALIKSNSSDVTYFPNAFSETH
jgi:putative endonuclease